MDSQEVIKSVIPHYCPNCNQEIFVKIHSLPPSLASVLTREDITNAKQEVLRRLTATGMAEKTLKEIESEIMDESVLFGPEDVEGILETYSK